MVIGSRVVCEKLTRREHAKEQCNDSNPVRKKKGSDACLSDMHVNPIPTYGEN